ncbi:coenzyme F420-0:L-glutamate ligase [Nocardioides panacisoli]|uniref:coenzyme F420-0:L-glutamate ligase n=1 Tax=Nocardioides panacisoli TaxID=627624 RepID=UPI001C63B75F|nr:coenzyme F420-0:L-glutamate ligase [Nocardioides panacisoli]QYJ04402.1 coenzyme F420-0:L-glutamate ligase [Nocardioides panacisoli]
MNLTVHAPDGVPEVGQGDDLAALLLAVTDLRDGDVVAVTSKVVSKVEGRVVAGDRDDWVAAETARVVATRGPTRIVRNRLGLTLAAAGVDGSNVRRGSSLLLPEDPDASARRLRKALHDRTGATVGVLVTDTAGRPWRNGQTDIAIGAAGVRVVEDFAGRHDPQGNELAVTAPAVADELAGAAELASGKLGGRPFAVLRGRPDLVLPAGEDGPGTAPLVRAVGEDLFGYGAREAVVRAVRADAEDAAPFGHPVPAAEMAAVLRRAGLGEPTRSTDGSLEVATTREDALAAVAFAHGWAITGRAQGSGHRLLPRTP